MELRKIALVGNSDPQPPEERPKIAALIRLLADLGVETEASSCLLSDYASPRDRAAEMNRFFSDGSFDAVCDLSGGDLANEVLPFLDYGAIAASRAVFWGYSDLSTVINAIYRKTGKSSVLYQLKNLVWDETGEQIERFRRLLRGEEDLFRPRWEALRGEGAPDLARDTVLGGNSRCFLKLAGTPYFPDLTGKLLLLEAMGGSEAKLATYFAQLEQLGVFHQVKGVLLGTFLQLEADPAAPTAYRILEPHLPPELPVWRTGEIGHRPLSRAVRLG